MTLKGLGLIIVAAGVSRRMDGVDKAWAPLGGTPVVAHSLIRLAPLAEATVLVVRTGDVARARDEFAAHMPALVVVEGGDDRRGSVARGLDSLGVMDLIAVHDAARPFAEAATLERCLQAMREGVFAGAVPVEPVDDTLKEVGPEGRVVRTLDRSRLRAAQTPQVFRREALHAAHQLPDDLPITDDAGLVEEAGYEVCTVEGSPMAFKLTRPFDWYVATLIAESPQPA